MRTLIDDVMAFVWLIGAALLYFGPMIGAFAILSDKGYDWPIAALAALASWVGLLIALIAPYA